MRRRPRYRPPEFPEFLKRDPPPDLQKMVTHYGGYQKIPLDTWARYDYAWRQWQYRRGDRLIRGAK